MYLGCRANRGDPAPVPGADAVVGTATGQRCGAWTLKKASAARRRLHAPRLLRRWQVEPPPPAAPYRCSVRSLISFLNHVLGVRSGSLLVVCLCLRVCVATRQVPSYQTLVPVAAKLLLLL